MDLKIDRLSPMNITVADDNDLRIDVSKAVDLDMSKTTFSSFDEGVDLGEFMKEKVGNYDYLDIDEEAIHTIPSPDVDASVVPELEAAMMPESIGRGQGSTIRSNVVHHEHLRTERKADLPKVDVEGILVAARKLMTAGVRGREVLVRLASLYPQHAMEAAWPTLKTFDTDQWLLGSVILEPELFASCKEMGKFLKDNKVANTSKLVKACSECDGCPYRKQSFCEAFQKSLVTKLPESPKLLQAYLGEDFPASKVATVAGLALKKAGSPLRALAQLIEARSVAARRVVRKQVEATAPSYRIPEPRTSASSPRETVVATLANLVDQGLTVDKIRTHTATYIGTASFDRLWKEATESKGVLAWKTYGICDHPLLMKSAVVKMVPGPKCAGCTHNYGDRCAVNGKIFTRSFAPPVQVIDAADIVRGEEQPFVGAETELTVEPSTPQVASLEADEVELTGEIEV